MQTKCKEYIHSFNGEIRLTDPRFPRSTGSSKGRASFSVPDLSVNIRPRQARPLRGWPNPTLAFLDIVGRQFLTVYTNKSHLAGFMFIEISLNEDFIKTYISYFYFNKLFICDIP